MKKNQKILCLMLAAMLIVGTAVSTAAASDSSTLPYSASSIDLGILPSTTASIEKWEFSPNATFTQEDRDNNFIKYASPDATTTLSSNSASAMNKSSDGSANVVGVVLDTADKPISGATIYANDQKIISTGKDGRFQITNMPNAIYDWKISAPGYEDSHYLNYPVDGSAGANIFKFRLDTDNPTVVDRDDFDHDEQCIPPESSADLDKSEVSPLAMSSVPSVKSDVKVLNISGRIPREEYIAGVVAKEAYAPSWYKQRGLTDAQVLQYYVAQAIAANTFLEYAQSVYSNHGSAADVCSTSHCQAYDPTLVTQVALDAAADIFYTVGGEPSTIVTFYEPTSNSYEYIWGAYFSSCGNRGSLNYSGQPALRAVSCTDLTSGAGGNRYGMCQMGAAQLAKNGYNAGQIIDYYYYSTDTEFCPLE